MTKHYLPKLSFLLALILLSLTSYGQDSLKATIAEIAKKLDGKVGVDACLLETGKHLSYHGKQRFPMQSVYKFPIAMAVLDKVDKGQFKLNQKVPVYQSDIIPVGHSPIRERYPNGGVKLTLEELIRLSVSESGGTACDVLLRLLGRTENANAYVHQLCIKNLQIATTEKVQQSADTIQYKNWSTPAAMTKLLKLFYVRKPLSSKSQSYLLKLMTDSYGDHRIKGLLPEGTVVAHKTGTSATKNGLTRATNDAGIINLPDGKHIAITVFIADSYANEVEREQAIAKISKAIFDDWKNIK